ncbi:MAG: hypothetical protein R3D99_11790 [Altererythrobacter sp.]
MPRFDPHIVARKQSGIGGKPGVLVADGVGHLRVGQRVDRVVFRGVEIDKQPQFLAGIGVDLFQQVAHQPCFGLGERAPVAVEVDAAGAVAPVPAYHAIGIEQRDRHDLEPLAKLACRVIIAEQLLHEREHSQCAGDFGWVLAPDQHDDFARFGIADLDGPDFAPFGRLAQSKARHIVLLLDRIEPRVVGRWYHDFLRGDE